MKSQTAKWVFENREDINILDVRSPAEFQEFHIPGANNIPLGGLIFNADSLLDKEKEYHVICASGARSYQAYMELESKGYKVVQTEGGNNALR
ncbi:MAG: rhodanese-like domain-containing protein [Mycoplasmataceae bacterium]|nr:rhodanese-like domain-containing protein [Mycoplasmataceae bacterium]